MHLQTQRGQTAHLCRLVVSGEGHGIPCQDKKVAQNGLSKGQVPPQHQILFQIQDSGPIVQIQV